MLADGQRDGELDGEALTEADFDAVTLFVCITEGDDATLAEAVTDGEPLSEAVADGGTHTAGHTDVSSVEPALQVAQLAAEVPVPQVAQLDGVAPVVQVAMTVEQPPPGQHVQ